MREDLRKKLAGFEHRLETWPALWVVAELLWAILIVLGALVAVVQWVQEAFGLAAAAIAAALIFLLLLLVVEYQQVLRLRRRREEILKRDRHIRSLIEAIRHSSQLQEIDYKQPTVTYLYDIRENGESYCEKEVEIAPVAGATYMVRVLIGCVGASVAVQNVQDLEVVAKNLDDGAPLLVVPIRDTPGDREFVVILDKRIVNDETARLSVTWRHGGLWKQLIEENRDEGVLRVEHRVGTLKKTFMAPRGWKWHTFKCAPELGTHTIEEQGGRSCIVWTADDVSPRDYAYKVFWRRAD